MRFGASMMSALTAAFVFLVSAGSAMATPAVNDRAVPVADSSASLPLAVDEVLAIVLNGLLTFDQAQKVSVDPASSLGALARSRPARDELVSAVRLKIWNSANEQSVYKVQRMRLTDHPLEYYTAIDPTGARGSVAESGLSLFGFGSVVYVANFSPRKTPVASSMRVVEGQMFTLDQSFRTVQTSEDGAKTLHDCRPEKQMDARDFHADLGGRAALFHCDVVIDVLVPFSEKHVYLDAYAQYFPVATLGLDDVALMTFQLVDVVVSRTSSNR